MADLKDIIGQAKDMLGDKAAQAGNKGGISDIAKNILGDKAGDMVASEEVKKKATEIVQKITPDSLDGKAAEVVDSAFDMLKNVMGKK
ncbi:MAG: hypothetical protein MJZ74_08980 [Muribaculaceae bacterium]|nr:hypothetical protein [Muribaculaceae bacterium]